MLYLYFKAHLTCFTLLIVAIISFFLGTVFISIGYVWFYKGVIHFLGDSNHTAETAAFVLSALALTVIAFPSMSLLY